MNSLHQNQPLVQSPFSTNSTNGADALLREMIKADIPPGQTVNQGEPLGADLPQPVTFASLLAEVGAIEKGDLKFWLLGNAERFVNFTSVELEKLADELHRRDMPRTWIDRKFLAAVRNCQRSLEQSQLSARVQADFAKLGYSFSYNECTSEILNGDQALDDGKTAKLRVQMRDRGYTSMMAVEDVLLYVATENSFHPVKRYLESLTWDGHDHIAALAAHFKDQHSPIVYTDGQQRTVIHAFLRRWLVGSICKIYTRIAQNAMLVLAGSQDLGKSSFVQWLCPLPEHLMEASINPDKEEVDRLLAMKWIWEVGELGSTTRRADREALKALLTKQEVTFRVPYAKNFVKRGVMTSFIGTINPEGSGFLSDPTGNRRYMVVELESLNWKYTALDVDQVWAQAFAISKTGENWRLTPEEAAQQAAINKEHEIRDPLEDTFRQHFKLGEDAAEATMTTGDIIDALRDDHKYKGDERPLSMRIAATLKKLGVAKFSDGNKRGYKDIMHVPNHDLHAHTHKE